MKKSNNKSNIMTASELGQSKDHKGRHGYTLMPNMLFSLDLKLSERELIRFVMSWQEFKDPTTGYRKQLSNYYIAKGTGMSERTVASARKVLVEKGVLTVMDSQADAGSRKKVMEHMRINFKMLEVLVNRQGEECKKKIVKKKDESDIEEIIETAKVEEFSFKQIGAM